MLQGLYAPTSGRGYVGGFDIESEQDDVRLNLGVCPQHDILWPTLSVLEHVIFYARVKGVPAVREDREVRRRSALLAGV